MSGSAALSTDLDALFKLPLGEFTAARNALAAQLKKAGRQADADRAKALPKPSVSAWVVNQLYWHQRAAFDRLLEAGERLRRAQAAQPAGTAAREAVSARREAVAALAAIAADLLRAGGYGAARDMLRRVTTTLEALSTYGDLPHAPAAGRLTEDVEPPGFDTLAALLPGDGSKPRAAGASAARGRPPGAAEPARRTGRRATAVAAGQVAAAKTAVRKAERALGSARRRADRAAAALATAESRARESRAQRAEIEKRLALAVKKADAAAELLRAATAGAQEAAQAAEGAERALEVARGRLHQLTA